MNSTSESWIAESKKTGQKKKGKHLTSISFLNIQTLNLPLLVSQRREDFKGNSKTKTSVYVRLVYTSGSQSKNTWKSHKSQ